MSHHIDTKTKTKTRTAEETLFHIADECGVSIERFDDETLDDFAERLVEEIKERKNEIDSWIDEVERLDLDEDEDDAS